MLGFKSEPFDPACLDQINDAPHLLLILYNLVTRGLLLGLGNITGIRQKIVLIPGEDQDSVASSEATEIPHILQACYKKTIKGITDQQSLNPAKSFPIQRLPFCGVVVL